ncbi:hypothetical protein F5B17DRAFT_381619 [Nemania serpens]|nr:hypothetical protein F5B17DRAFT_381619 [Nemania serpens]
MQGRIAGILLLPICSSLSIGAACYLLIAVRLRRKALIIVCLFISTSTVKPGSWILCRSFIWYILSM